MICSKPKEQTARSIEEQDLERERERERVAEIKQI